MSEVKQDSNFLSDFTSRINSGVRNGDISLAIGVVFILALLIMPMPRWLLDINLAISITFSVLILMTVVYIQKPLEFSSFPTVLLIATMLRLALNLASTRLILSNGHTGTDAAGHIIQAFGNFVMGGNFIIGIIIFGILVIVNFVVITKGSGRIAEVSARFSLDAMPGKQMAIDADLSAGLIDEEEAKTRRKELENESNFYGSMDGAAKFVRGDAIAGILITFINVIGGIIIGTSQHGLSLGEAGNSYTLLTVGDGLVSQIPALIVSTAAGLLVSRAGVTGSTEKALFGQLSGYPNALGLSSVLMAGLSILPGIPVLPFLTLSLVTGGFALKASQKKEKTALEEAQKDIDEPEQIEEEQPISKSLAMDPIRLELGFNLIQLVNNEHKGQKLTDQIKALRRQIATEVGFVVPAVRIQDNMQLNQNSYVITVKEVVSGQGELKMDMFLVMDPKGGEIDLPGEKTTEPTFGLPAVWITEAMREEAMFRGYTVVDPITVVTTHITETIKDNMPDLLSYAETQKLLDGLSKEQQKLTNDIVPNQITASGIQRVLQNLLSERISIRDLPTILEGIAEASAQSKNIVHITEHTRQRLARQISDSQTGRDGFISMINLSPKWENIFHSGLTMNGDEVQLSVPPSDLQVFMSVVRQEFEKQAVLGQSPVLVTSAAIRPYVRMVIERFRPMTFVMSQSEIHPKAQLKTLGQIE